VRNMRSTYNMHGRLFPGADNLLFKRYFKFYKGLLFLIYALINISRTTVQHMCTWNGIQILTICLISKGLLFFYTPCTVCPPKKYPLYKLSYCYKGTFWGDTLYRVYKKKTQPRNFLRNHFAILKHKIF
jgi:hypothetical protein